MYFVISTVMYKNPDSCLKTDKKIESRHFEIKVIKNMLEKLKKRNWNNAGA